MKATPPSPSPLATPARVGAAVRPGVAERCGTIRYGIIPAVYRSLSNRGDGVVIPGDAFR